MSAKVKKAEDKSSSYKTVCAKVLTKLSELKKEQPAESSGSFLSGLFGSGTPLNSLNKLITFVEQLQKGPAKALEEICDAIHKEIKKYPNLKEIEGFDSVTKSLPLKESSSIKENLSQDQSKARGYGSFE